MKIREMDIYFTVPVDADTLKTCRIKAGYKTVASFGRELKQRGGPATYSNIECNYTKGSSRIRGDVAELIAKVLGMPVSWVFPKYNEAKAAIEQMVNDRYYKPFETVEERNSAIEAAMENVRRTAYKHCRLIKNQNGGHYLEQEDIAGIAYISLIQMADRAMKKGIKKGVCFEAAACVAVKNDFLRINKDNQMVCRKAEIYSLDESDADNEDDYYSLHPDPFCFEDVFIAREECLTAIRTVPRELWKNKEVADCLIAIVFPQGVPSYA